FQIMVRNFLRFRAIADVFSQAGEDRCDLPSAKRLRSNKRVVQRLAGHKARNTSPHKAVMRSVVSQPAVLRSGQQKRAHQAHSAFFFPEWSPAIAASACSAAAH